MGLSVPDLFIRKTDTKKGGVERLNTGIREASSKDPIGGVVFHVVKRCPVVEGKQGNNSQVWRRIMSDKGHTARPVSLRADHS